MKNILVKKRKLAVLGAILLASATAEKAYGQGVPNPNGTIPTVGEDSPNPSEVFKEKMDLTYRLYESWVKQAKDELEEMKKVPAGELNIQKYLEVQGELTANVMDALKDHGIVMQEIRDDSELRRIARQIDIIKASRFMRSTKLDADGRRIEVEGENSAQTKGIRAITLKVKDRLKVLSKKKYKADLALFRALRIPLYYRTEESEGLGKSYYRLFHQTNGGHAAYELQSSDAAQITKYVADRLTHTIIRRCDRDLTCSVKLPEDYKNALQIVQKFTKKEVDLPLPTGGKEKLDTANNGEWFNETIVALESEALVDDRQLERLKVNIDEPAYKKAKTVEAPKKKK